MHAIDRATVQSFPFEESVKAGLSHVSVTPGEFYGQPGREHYRLLATLASKLTNSLILDIGTHMGSSALALSVNPTNRILSFDIQRKTPLRDLPNVSFELADLWDPDVRTFWEPTILKAAMIVLDIDPHSGTPEYEFYQWLKSKNYRGLLVLDDIWYFKGMRDNFWLKVPAADKLDISPLGHFSGTGVIAFQPQPFQFETLLGMRSIGELATLSAASPWTVVTAYFDLTRMPDASKSIRDRPRGHYLASAAATMSLEQNLVVFCEADSLEILKGMRPAHLLERTRFEVVDFESLPMTKYRSKIQQNRVEKPYQQDDRNTPSYYLLCMARYALLKRIIEENPFNSTHFAWLNICIERMGVKNVEHLDEVFLTSPPRDKVSTAYIDYLSRAAIADEPEFWKFGRCSMCSGFFTGRWDMLTEFCDRVEEKFLLYLEHGYGHADEQLFSPVYFDAPDLFEHYYADYQQMITNYVHTYENPDITLRLLIPKSKAAKDWRVCLAACEFLWTSHQKKTIALTDDQLKDLIVKYVSAASESGDLDAAKKTGALAEFHRLSRA